MKKLMMAGMLVALVGLSGCASIVGDKTQTEQISSNPAGASFVIKDEK